jgi:hypothetical protein
MIPHGTGDRLRRLGAWMAGRLAGRDEMHGIAVSIRHDSREHDPRLLRAKLGEALGLIAAHAPVWIARMRRMGVRIHVERTPGTRAKLVDGKVSVLDSYFVHAFLPAQIASSIVHEATHARVRARGPLPPGWTLAREERMCRRSELRFGRLLRAAGEPGADAVLARAEASLALADDDVAPTVDWSAQRHAAEIHRLREAPLPGWLRRWIARGRGPAGGAAAGESRKG